MFRPVLARLREEFLLLALLLALVPLLWLVPLRAGELVGLVDWKTIGALAGLMVLSRGLEDSGCLTRAGHWLLQRMHTERMLATALVLFSAILSAVITNDVALFIVVPLTVGLHRVTQLPIGRLVIFEALAVNAGSAISPIGNPQNLFLWQSSGVSFVEFAYAILPLGIALLLLLLAVVPLAFSGHRLNVIPSAQPPALYKSLQYLSLAAYPLFLLATDLGFAGYAALGVILFYLIFFRQVLLGVDWLLLLIFMLMFIDLGLLARWPAIVSPVEALLALPGDIFTGGVVLSQFLSNVPAAIFLEPFSDDWRLLAWGVNVGGFGLAVGSLANLIALRLARQPGLWKEFHCWSIPMLIASCAAVVILIG